MKTHFYSTPSSTRSSAAAEPVAAASATASRPHQLASRPLASASWAVAVDGCSANWAAADSTEEQLMVETASSAADVESSDSNWNCRRHRRLRVPFPLVPRPALRRGAAGCASASDATAAGRPTAAK